MRLGGSIGLTSVRWEVLGDVANDIISKEGTLNFLDSQAANQFELQVRADAEPELDHVVTIRLVNVTKVGLYKSLSYLWFLGEWCWRVRGRMRMLTGYSLPL